MGLTPLGLAGRLVKKAKQLNEECTRDTETIFLLKDAAEKILQLERDLEVMTRNYYDVCGTTDFGQ